MSDWLGLGLIILIVVLALVAASRLGAPRKQMTVEEYERRVEEGSAGRAAMFGLQQLLNPTAAKSVAVQQDLRAGYYNKKKLPGEGGDDEEAVEGAEQAPDGGGAAGEAGPVEPKEIREGEERDA